MYQYPPPICDSACIGLLQFHGGSDNQYGFLQPMSSSFPWISIELSDPLSVPNYVFLALSGYCLSWTDLLDGPRNEPDIPYSRHTAFFFSRLVCTCGTGTVRIFRVLWAPRALSDPLDPCHCSIELEADCRRSCLHPSIACSIELDGLQKLSLATVPTFSIELDRFKKLSSIP